MARKRTERMTKKTPKKPKYKRQVRKKEMPLYAYVEERAKRIAREIASHIRESTLDEGGIIFVHGPHYSGKTSVGCGLDESIDPLRRFVRGQPRADDRSDVLEGFFYKRKDGSKCPAISFSTKREIEQLFDEHEIVVMDYVQFIPYELQSFFLRELDDFVERGGWFIALGLLFNSLRNEFLLSFVIRQKAVKEYKLTTTCQQCGRRNATLTQRLVDGRPPNFEDPELVPPSDKVVYEPRCEDCHVVIT